MKNIADCTTRNGMRLFHHSTVNLKSMWCAFLYAKPWTPPTIHERSIILSSAILGLLIDIRIVSCSGERMNH